MTYKKYALNIILLIGIFSFSAYAQQESKQELQQQYLELIELINKEKINGALTIDIDELQEQADDLLEQITNFAEESDEVSLTYVHKEFESFKNIINNVEILLSKRELSKKTQLFSYIENKLKSIKKETDSTIKARRITLFHHFFTKHMIIHGKLFLLTGYALTPASEFPVSINGAHYHAIVWQSAKKLFNDLQVSWVKSGINQLTAETSETLNQKATDLILHYLPSDIKAQIIKKSGWFGNKNITLQQRLLSYNLYKHHTKLHEALVKVIFIFISSDLENLQKPVQKKTLTLALDNILQTVEEKKEELIKQKLTQKTASTHDEAEILFDIITEKVTILKAQLDKKAAKKKDQLNKVIEHKEDLTTFFYNFNNKSLQSKEMLALFNRFTALIDTYEEAAGDVQNLPRNFSSTLRSLAIDLKHLKPGIVASLGNAIKKAFAGCCCCFINPNKIYNSTKLCFLIDSMIETLGTIDPNIKSKSFVNKILNKVEPDQAGFWGKILNNQQVIDMMVHLTSRISGLPTTTTKGAVKTEE